MDLLRGIEALPLDADGSVVTVGFFDGVHRGHQAVFRTTVQRAGDRGAPAVAVTFDRHPREILTPGTAPRLLTTLERKARLVEATGVDVLVVLAFTEEFSRWPAEDFVDRVLAGGLHAGHVVVGANFTFGHKALGTLQTLSEIGPPRGFSAEGMSLLTIDGRRVSSTSVREALDEGDLDWPERALGRRYLVDGTVVPGAGRGRDLGFPTANLEVPARMLIPKDGVYAGRARLEDGTAHVAAINVGTNPTFGEEPRHVEAFLLDFEGDIRGRPIAVEFWARLRDEIRFDGPEALAAQIAEDVGRTRELVPAAADQG
ncbi:MAG: bifunctional riboflavin kinase/FAD synthetase [Actinobacteria bacterium]|nr:bifunctional riboflavin kinase/FAD synthetase [Actinomycetota bacterium]